MATEDRANGLIELGAATVGESGGAPLAPSIHAMWPGAVAAGPAYAVECAAGDNLALHAATAEAPPGSILCASFAAPDPRGYWGEVLATAALARGLAGLVIDGGVRDCEALERLSFPVFATGLVLRGASKVAPGRIGATAMVGGVTVRTGDWVVGDRDGVAVIPSQAIDAVLDAGRARMAREVEMFAALRRGATTIELLDLDTAVIERA